VPGDKPHKGGRVSISVKKSKEEATVNFTAHLNKGAQEEEELLAARENS